MTLGLEKIKDILKSETEKDIRWDKTDRITVKRQANKSKTQEMENHEKKSEAIGKIQIDLKGTKQRLEKEFLSPADRTKAEKTGIVFFLLSIGLFLQLTLKEKNVSFIPGIRFSKKELWTFMK